MDTADNKFDLKNSSEGLEDIEIEKLRSQYGFNEIPEFRENIFLLYLKNFWGPLAWLMELMIIITYLSGNVFEAAVIACLLLVNAFINIYQRRSTETALATLRHSVQVIARVKRSDIWRTIASRELLPGDVIRLRAGDIIPADAKIIEGDLNIDLSTLTGESVPREVSIQDSIYSGGVVRRGGATAIVSAIGSQTQYGKTTELLEISHPPTHMEKVVFSIIKYFFVLNVFVAIAVIIFGIAVHAPTLQIMNFAIVLLLMSVPVAFPTMFAVAQTYGALQLNDEGTNNENEGKRVLVRRLAAVQESAIMDVLCIDKTGTLTQNTLSVSKIICYGNTDEKRLLMLASACSDKAGEDPIDQAVLQKAAEQNVDLPKQISFSPFDPSTKGTKAEIIVGVEKTNIEMGLADLLLTSHNVLCSEKALRDVVLMSDKGLRVLAVVTGDIDKKCEGLIGLNDPIRPDAPGLIQELNALGVRVVMITGDGRITAQAVAKQLSLRGDVFTPSDLKKDPEIAIHGAVFAEVYPGDKLMIIKALQKAGHVVGMTGDGVNDAPALHQAEVGVAVYGATEVAKQAASFILTSPGLEGIRRVVTAGRRVYMRIRTWALNKVIKSIETLSIATVIFLLTHSYILSPLIAVLVLLSNDFVTISIATDHTKPLLRPAHWNIPRLIVALIPIVFIMFIYFISIYMNYSFDVTRTIIYCTLIYLGKATILSIRAWPFGWSVRPSKILVGAIIFSLSFASLIAGFGIFIAAIPLIFFPLIIGSSILSFFMIEGLKRLNFVRTLLDIE